MLEVNLKCIKAVTWLNPHRQLLAFLGFLLSSYKHLRTKRCPCFPVYHCLRSHPERESWSSGDCQGEIWRASIWLRVMQSGLTITALLSVNKSWRISRFLLVPGKKKMRMNLQITQSQHEQFEWSSYAARGFAGVCRNTGTCRSDSVSQPRWNHTWSKYSPLHPLLCWAVVSNWEKWFVVFF